MSLQDKKVLVAYFSRSGQNYANGEIINLAVGNTQIAAEILAKLTHAKLFEIKPRSAYPEDYNKCVDISIAELKANARPQLAEDIDTDAFDIICIGYPNWCSTMPMPVWTFLESHNLDGKTILPFCTHEGSGLSDSEKDMAKLCPKAQIKPGIAIRGTKVSEAQPLLESWLSDNGL